MKTAVQSNKADQAKLNSINHMNGMHEFSSDGRVYQSEKYSGPLKQRATAIWPKEEKIKKLNETVTYLNIKKAEQYLGKKEKYIVAEAFAESKIEDDNASVFQALCDNYPLARNYKSWGDLYYSMRNRFTVRKTPMKTYKIEVNNNQHFNFDDCKPLYSNGDTVYIVHYDDKARVFMAFKATVMCYYTKPMGNDKFDIMYQLRSECYTTYDKSGWKLQGNNTVFATMEEAVTEAKKRNKKL